MESWNRRLGAAAFNGDVEDLQLCIDNGANSEYRGYKEGTALMSAARQGHLEIIRILINNGCNKDASDKHGRKAIHLAAYHGHLKIVKYLVEKVGISPMIKTNQGETPYNSAAKSEAKALKGIESFNKLIHPTGGPVNEVTMLPPRDVKEYLQTLMSKLDENVKKETPEQTSSTPTDDMVPNEIKSMSDKKYVPLYLKLLASGSEKKRDIRLVIVGKKGSGKTSLLKRLFGEDMRMIREVNSTNGIEIHKIRCNAYTDEGIWNKVDGSSAETDLHARLLKPYEKTLKSQGEDNTDESVQEVAQVTPTVATEPQVTPPLINESNITPNVFTEPEVTPLVSTEPNVTPLVSTERHVTPIDITANELQPISSIEQAYKDIETMLKSEVDLYDKEEYATLLLWDFAGDEEFYHTHQTFLSPDAIYLVVTKLNETDDKEAQDLFRLWMDSIHCYSNRKIKEQKHMYDDNSRTDDYIDPPVIIVGTWKDAVTSDSAEIMEACRNRLLMFTEHLTEGERRHIRDDVTISNTEDDSVVFQQIRQDILKLARTLSTWNKDYPLKFIQLEKCLQEKKKQNPIITFTEIEQISSKTPQPLNTEELLLYLKFHHEIRALVYFEDLQDYIILDTQWLADAFKCIVTAKKFSNVSIKNQKRWEEFLCRGKLHCEVLEDIFQKEDSTMYKYKDHILEVMEKFDILIHPNISERYVPGRNICFYVPCMIKAEPERDIYEMLNVTKQTCEKSTWLCFKFTFLPPYLFHHLIASLSRKYDIAEVGIPKQKKRQISLFRSTVVYELQKTKLRKLLVMTFQNIIQIQVLEFGKVVEAGLYWYVAKYVAKEINNIIRLRFKMSNIKFEKKWECGLTEPEYVTGSNDFIEEDNTQYLCEMCTTTHKFVDEWSEEQNTINYERDSFPSTDPRASSQKLFERTKKDQDSNPHKERTNQIEKITTEVHIRLKTDLKALSNVSESSRKDILRGLTKEENNFTMMGMIVLNILTDVLYDLLRPDRPHLPHRSECDIAYLYRNLRTLNKNIPSNRWGGEWLDIQNTDISIGDDIERIRLTRNELQHSKTFNLCDKRFTELCNVIGDLLRRFDQHNKPSRLYTVQLNDILAKIVSLEDVELVKTVKVKLMKD